MRKTYFSNLILGFISMFILIGCSSHSSNPVSAPLATESHPEIDIPSTEIDSAMMGHELLGVWNMTFDPEKMTASIEPNRELGWHFNVKSFIPTPGIVLNSWDSVNKIIDINITLKNPYPITGYDVRLIIYTDAAGHLLLDPDDWTALYDISGGQTINPFKAYAKSEPNRIFTGSTSHVENLQIYMDSSFYVNFAIDASYPSNCQEPYEIWDFTQEDPLYDREHATAAAHVRVRNWHEPSTTRAFIECPGVFDGLEFNTSDNELFYVELDNDEGAPAGTYQALLIADILENATIDLYDYATIYITPKPIHGWIWHWTSDDSCSAVETDTGGNIYVALNPSQKVMCFTNEPNEKWEFDLDWLGPVGQLYDLSYHPDFDFIYSTGGFYYCGTQPYSGFGVYKSDIEYGTTNNSNYQCISDFFSFISDEIEGDSHGNAYIAGAYEWSNENTEALWKVDSNLNSQWLNVWNDEGSLHFSDIEISSGDTLYASGEFWGDVVDFDPSDGVANNYPQGNQDSFIIEFDSAGNRIDMVKWGGYSDGLAVTYATAIGYDDDGEIFVFGDFNGTVDFNPNMIYEDVKSSTGRTSDIYISKFNPDFLFMKNIQISGDEYLMYNSNLAIDSAGNIYISGGFIGTVDFDPGSGVVQRSAKGNRDMFLAKYTNSLGFIYVQTWGASESSIQSTDIAYDRTFNYVYLVGYFYGTIDFDPGEGSAIKTSNSGYDPFLMRLLPNGTWEY